MSTGKRIVLTGGGTAGHVTPNLALVQGLEKRGYEVHYVGRHRGMERDLVSGLNIPYHGIRAGKLRRYFDLQNLFDIVRTLSGVVTSLSLLSRLRPSVVFSKGGFVSCPVVWAAWILRIPVVLHESDITPGLANKLSTPCASAVCCAFAEAAGHVGRKAVVTGLPVRTELLEGDAQSGRDRCGFTDIRPVLLILGGSQGARAINEAIRANLGTLLESYQICHVCGNGNTDTSLQRPGYCQFEYEDLGDLLAMADLVVSRAGATSLFEFVAARKANLLIPLPLSASRGDQILNAESFARAGYSKVLRQEELTPESFLGAVAQAMEEAAQMREYMAEAKAARATELVLDVIDEAARGIRN